MPDPVLKTVDESAALLGVSRRTLYSMMEREEIAWVQVGGRRKVSVQEIERLTGLDVEEGSAA